MIYEDEKTPALLILPALLLEESSNTPAPRRRPPGRPAGTLSVSEMVAKITLEVTARAKLESEQFQADLRATVQAEVRSAAALAIAAMALNALGLAAVLVLNHLIPRWVAAVGATGMLLFFLGYAGALGRERPARTETRRPSSREVVPESAAMA